MTTEALPSAHPPSHHDSITEPPRHSRLIGAVVVSISLVAGFATFMVLAGLTPLRPTGRVVDWFLIGNAGLVMALIGATGREFYALWRARQRGRAAARFHIRIVLLFSLIAMFPAVLVAIFAYITLDRGLDRWFQERTREIVENSISVANAYVREHAGVLRGDLIAMATDINRARPVYDFDPRRFDSYFSSQARLRQMPAAFMLNGKGEVLTGTGTDPAAKPLRPPLDALKRAENGDPVLIGPDISGTAGDTNYVGFVLQLDNYDDVYLYVTRAVDPRVVQYQRLAQASADEYTALSSSRAGVQVTFALVYIGLSLVLLLSAAWVGIGFANRIVAPVRRLIAAADEVAGGNLSVAVPVRQSEGDLGNLGATFNTMIRELNNQRNELVETNRQLDQRRRFTEAVLAGVTAGVLGIAADGKVTLANASALSLLELSHGKLVGRHLVEVMPELDAVIRTALESRRKEHEEQLVLNLASGPRTFVVRATIERSSTSDKARHHGGMVLTLDDITDLVAAQRSAAWADVARRIAHEIKNPLTPIQLSAERLQRRFGRKIQDESGVFDQCVQTIVRQVGDIGRMVDEFSAFARMPKPNFIEADLRETVREAVFLQSVSHPEISFNMQLGDRPIIVRHDQRLLTQAFTNIIKNATEAIESVPEIGDSGRISVALIENSGNVQIGVADNGIGFPEEARQQLLEPYMTTREKGTGLGLAIVRKIVEDHGGFIELTDAPVDKPTGRKGAMVRLTFATAHATAGNAAEASRTEEKATGAAPDGRGSEQSDRPDAGNAAASATTFGA